jgi:hypothetical protein
LYEKTLPHNNRKRVCGVLLFSCPTCRETLLPLKELQAVHVPHAWKVATRAQVKALRRLFPQEIRKLEEEADLVRNRVLRRKLLQRYRQLQ